MREIDKREIKVQGDADRLALIAETGGQPILDLAAHSNSKSSPFIDYIYADILHSLQKPRSQEPDELFFIQMAQIMELQYSMIGSEVARAAEALKQDNLPLALQIMARIHAAQDYLTGSWRVVASIGPLGYLGFRDHFGVASGFGSFTYRRLEFLLGNKQPRMLQPHAHIPEVHAMLQEISQSPCIYDEAIALLARNGHPIDPQCLDRDWGEPYQPNDSVRAAWMAVYRKGDRTDPFYLLAESLMGIGDRFKTFRYRHFVTVERLIGFKPGTGGTSGIGWLRAVIDQNFFPELWELRTDL